MEQGDCQVNDLALASGGANHIMFKYRRSRPKGVMALKATLKRANDLSIRSCKLRITKTNKTLIADG
jgi:hypothetical protein